MEIFDLFGFVSWLDFIEYLCFGFLNRELLTWGRIISLCSVDLVFGLFFIGYLFNSFLVIKDDGLDGFLTIDGLDEYCIPYSGFDNNIFNIWGYGFVFCVVSALSFLVISFMICAILGKI